MKTVAARWIGFLGFVSVLLLAGCNYDTPLTDKPTRKVTSYFFGEWQSVDKDTGKIEKLIVQPYDDSHYVAAMDNDLYRVFHSDFSGKPFLSVQDLNSGRKLYTYIIAELSTDGRQLTIRTIDTKVVPSETKGKAVRQLVKNNLNNPALLGEPLVFTRPPSGR